MGKNDIVTDLVIEPASQGATQGWARLGDLQWRCALGRSGISADKAEGDGTTPSGRFPIRRLFYRPDRVREIACAFPIQPMSPGDGWCDAPGDANYNRPVRHPYPASAERLWRTDALYDLIVVLDYNERPRVQGRGSAIFLHVARPGYQPTEGCIALARPHLLRLVARLGRASAIAVGAKTRPKLSLRAR